MSFGCLVVFELAATAEVGVGVVDAGVDDGDLALAGVLPAPAVGGAVQVAREPASMAAPAFWRYLGRTRRSSLRRSGWRVLDGLGVTAHCHAAYRLGGVETRAGPGC